MPELSDLPVGLRAVLVAALELAGACVIDEECPEPIRELADHLYVIAAEHIDVS